jgi:hypothetical protein
MDAAWVSTARLLWWTGAGGLVVLAAVFATRVPDVGSALGCGLVVGWVVAVVSLLGDCGEPPLQRGGRALVRAAGATVAVAAGLVLGLVMGPAVVLLLAVVAMSSPPVLRRLGRGTPDVAQPPACESVAGGPAPLTLNLVRQRFAELDLDEISLLWCRSLARLRTERNARERGWLVLLRQLLLDELDRRDPVALRRWLVAGPGADGDPTTYFRADGPPDRIAS